jgi:hypothetical protein
MGIKQVHHQIGQARPNIHRAGVSPDVYHLLGKCCNHILIFCLFIFNKANSCLIHVHPYLSNSGGSDLP